MNFNCLCLTISRSLILVFSVALTHPVFSQSSYIVRFQRDPFLFAQKVASSRDGKHLASFGTLERDGQFLPYFVNVDDSGKFIAGKYFQFPEERFSITAATGTSDNGYALAGLIRKNEENAIGFLNVTLNGSIKWTKQYPMTRYNEFITQVLDVSDGFLLLGVSYTDVFHVKLLIIKIDQEGNLVKRKTIGSVEPGIAVSAVAAPNSGPNGIVMCGRYGNDSLILKLDLTGKVVWARKYSGARNLNLFGGGITATPDGGFLTAAFAVRKDRTVIGICVLKTDALGNVLSSRLFATRNNRIMLGKVSATSEGGLTIAGELIIKEGRPPIHAFIMKVNYQGELEWTKLFHQQELSWFTDVAGLPDGTIAAIESAVPGPLLVRLSSNGQVSKDCDQYRNFPIDLVKMKITSSAVSLKSSQLNGSAANFSARAVNFRTGLEEVCSSMKP